MMIMTMTSSPILEHKYNDDDTIKKMCTIMMITMMTDFHQLKSQLQGNGPLQEQECRTTDGIHSSRAGGEIWGKRVSLCEADGIAFSAIPFSQENIFPRLQCVQKLYGNNLSLKYLPNKSILWKSLLQS